MRKILLLLLLFSSVCWAEFNDYGVMAPYSGPRGIISTEVSGRNTVFVWLADTTGGYELFSIDAVTGAVVEYPTPFSIDRKESFTSLLSTGNDFYTHFNSHLLCFDCDNLSYSVNQTTFTGTAMSMTEDDSGKIWVATYPDSGLMSYDPATETFTDYESKHSESWNQYPRYISADDQGFIYFGIGETESQIIIFNPSTSTATTVLPEIERSVGLGYVYRNNNGRVYARSLKDSGDWYECYDGVCTKIESHTKDEKTYITGMQGLFEKDFSNGESVETLDFLTKELKIEKDSEIIREFSFDYTSDGTYIMSIAVALDNTIFGGTMAPAHFFNYDSSTESIVNKSCYGQWNALTKSDDKVYVGEYSHGAILEWDPSSDWVATVYNTPECNPLWLCEGISDVARPGIMLYHEDTNTVILGGTPRYGLTGGGLIFWDITGSSKTTLTHSSVVVNQSTLSLVTIDSNQILGGTTISPGTGGETIATEAELYLMDLDTKTVTWHSPVISNIGKFSQLCMTSSGLVYGIADRATFFVFNPATKAVVYSHSLGGSIPYQQGQRALVRYENNIYIIYNESIRQVNPNTYEIVTLAETPVNTNSGGCYLAEEIFFSSDSKLYGYEIPSLATPADFAFTN